MSDQDWQATQPETAGRLELCERTVADGRADDIAFRWCPIVKADDFQSCLQMPQWQPACTLATDLHIVTKLIKLCVGRSRSPA